MLKKIILISFFLIIFSGSACSESFTVFVNESPPYVEKKSGLVIEILEELFKRSGLKAKIEFVPLSRAVFIIKRNSKCCSLLERSQERETEFKWVGPILIKQSAIYSKMGDNIKIDVLKDAFQYKILAVKGSSDYEYLKWVGFNVEVANSEYLNSLKLMNGRSRLWISDILTSMYYAKKINLKLKKQLNVKITLVPLAFNPNTGEAFINRLNLALDSIYRDNTVKKIYKKYGKKLSLTNAFYFFN